MVKVKPELPPFDEDGIDLELWLTKLSESNPHINLSRIRKVCELSEQAEDKALRTGPAWVADHSSFRMGLEMADILGDLHVDEDGLVAAIIYRAVRENQLTLGHVRKQFGKDVGDLVEGVLKMAAISNIQFGQNKPVLGERKDQLEQARRMLVTLVDDIRVALIKLAERTCAIRQASDAQPDRRLRLAREVGEIYAPLAHRLGIGHLKWELEDLSFRYMEPLSYKRIASLLDERRIDRDEYIGRVIGELDRKLRLVNIVARLEGRAKHIFSIWKKMRRKGIAFSEVYDVRAVRLLVDTQDDCYRALGVVHNLWRNIPNEFDDYIATPKENGYKSLHTAVIGPEGKVLEVQIRTEEMHEEAEFGVCSHWQYKAPEGDEEPSQYSERLEWLRQILEWQDEIDDLPELARDILTDVGVDRIYVFTPDGHVVDMPPGATLLDFAYRVHTEVGHKCRGAKVNGRVCQLNTALSSGDQVEIITADESEPRREWLHEHLGYVKTSRARAKIHAWFGKQEKQKNIDAGKKILLDEFEQIGVGMLDVDELADTMAFETAAEMFYAIAVGEADIASALESALSLTTDDPQMSLSLPTDEVAAPVQEILVTGMGDLPYRMSDCCTPVPGDSIIGLIDETDHVHVHLQECLQALRGSRTIKLDWADEVRSTFPVGIDVDAYDRAGLLYDIAGIFFRESTNLIAVQTLTDKQNNRVVLRMTAEVTSLVHLLQMLERIERLPNVISARRSVTA